LFATAFEQQKLAVAGFRFAAAAVPPRDSVTGGGKIAAMCRAADEPLAVIGGACSHVGWHRTLRYPRQRGSNEILKIAAHGNTNNVGPRGSMK
jgi:hypothetical protein